MAATSSYQLLPTYSSIFHYLYAFYFHFQQAQPTCGVTVVLLVALEHHRYLVIVIDQIDPLSCYHRNVYNLSLQTYTLNSMSGDKY